MEDLTVKSFNDDQALSRLNVDVTRADGSVAVFYSFFHICYKHLFGPDPREVVYPSTCVEAVWDANKGLVSDSAPGRGVVYAIYSCAGDGSGKKKKYVGSCKNWRDRFRAHFIKKQSANSCFDKIKTAVGCGEKIYVAWITVDPIHFYQCVEQSIIAIEKAVDRQALPWNGEPGTRPGRSQNSADS